MSALSKLDQSDIAVLLRLKGAMRWRFGDAVFDALGNLRTQFSEVDSGAMPTAGLSATPAAP